MQAVRRGIVGLIVGVGLAALEAAGQNTAFVPAYNALVSNLNARVREAGGVSVAPKAATASVTQQELDWLRQRVRSMMTSDYVVDPTQFDLSVNTSNTFPKGLRYNGTTLLRPSLMDGIGDGQGRFTKIPGKYTRSGATIFAESFTDAPVLWEHIEELLQAVKTLRVRLIGPGITLGVTAGWTAAGLANDRSAMAYGTNEASAMAACEAAWLAATPTLVNGYPAAGANLIVPGGFWTASRSLRYACFQLTGLNGGADKHVFFYLLGNRPTRSRLDTEFDAGGVDCREGFWHQWDTKAGGREAMVRSAPFGNGASPGWCRSPLAGPPGTTEAWRGYEATGVVAAVKWTFADLVPERPKFADPDEDGLSDSGCGCTACPIETAAVWDGLQPQARALFPLGVSDGALSGGLRVKAYLTEYELNGSIGQMYSLFSSVIWTAGTDGSEWQFVCVRRPSGAEIVFPTTGSLAGRPLEPANSYRLEKNGNAVKLRFPGANGEVVHEFLNNTLMAVAAKTGRKERRVDYVGGGAWPGLTAYAEYSPWGYRLARVASSLVTAEASYVNNVVRGVEYRYAAGGPTNRMVYYEGSKGFRNLDQYGRVIWDTRVVTRTNDGAVEIWSGISTNAGLRVARKERRRTWTDEATGLRMWETAVIADDGLPSVRSNVTLAALARYPWGEETVRVSVGAGSAVERTTRYEYYTNSADVGAYGLLRRVEGPDGGWTQYTYDALGRPRTVMTGLGNAAAGDTNDCRVTENAYAGDPLLTALNMPAEDRVATNDTCPRLVVERLAGWEVGRTFHSYQANREVTARAVRRGAAYDDPGNLVTTTAFATNGSFKGRPLRIDQPGGGLTTYAYSYDAARRELTVTEDSGTGGAGGVTNGLRTVTVSDVALRTLRTATTDLVSGIEVAATQNTLDWLGRVLTASNRVDGTVTRYQYGCCGPEEIIGPDGIRVSQTYDELKRLYASERLGVTTYNTYDVWGNTVERRQCAAGRPDVVTSSTYDEAGRLVRQVNERGVATRWSYGTNELGEAVVTTTHPDETTAVETSYRDGRLKNVTGTAVRARFHEYGADEAGAYTVVYQGSDSNATQWVKTYTDLLGRETAVVNADGYRAETFYDAAGRPVRSSDGWTTRLTGYDGKGEAFRSAVDMDGDGVIGLAGTDRIGETDSGYATFQGKKARWTETRAYDMAGSNRFLVTGRQWQSVDGTAGWNIAFGRTSRVDVARQPAAAARMETATRPDGTRLVSWFTNGLLRNTRWESAGGQALAEEAFAYDAFGRVESRAGTGPGGQRITTRYDYDSGGLLTNETVEAGGEAQTTRHAYDAMGRRTRTALPDGGAVSFDYEPTGELRAQSGARTYPVRYEHDAAGRLTALATFRRGTNAAPDVTRWSYDGRRGWLTAKTYADGRAPRYEYRADGHLARRIGARGIETAYGYDAAGSLTNVAYSDGTPGVSLTLDRLGRPIEIRDATGARTNVYAADGGLVREILSGGAGEVACGYDVLGRRTNLAIRCASGEERYRAGYGFDLAGRLETVRNGSNLTRYAYGADGRAVTGQVVTASGVERLRGTRRYDAFGRPAGVGWRAGGTNVADFAYGYNAAGQRERCDAVRGTNACYWGYAYDGLGQLTAARRYGAGGTPDPAAHFEYTYDLIGNRNSATDGTGVAAVYGVDDLNRYTNVSLAEPGREVNWSGTVFTFDGKGMSGERGSRMRNMTYSYDADGNLMAVNDPGAAGAGDGSWAYTWDAENRLVLASNATVVVSNAYDYLSRRVSKTVRTDSSVIIQHSSFLYDGWNLVSEIRYLPSEMRTNASWFVWGLDLSGAPQGAGGVGGLVFSSGGTTSVSSVFPLYDGNGNVTDLLDTNDASVGCYDYGPFGEVLHSEISDPSISNPFKFSTRYTDPETGLIMYPRRAYSPALGRFLSRDPIEEFGGFHLYGFVGNDPVNGVDPLGLEGLQGAGPLYWLGNQLTVPIRVSLGLVGSALSGDAFSLDSPDPVYDSDQCEFLITVTGIKMTDRESQIRFMRQIAGLNMFKGIRNPAWVNNPSRFWGIGDAVQILVNETLYAITVPDLRTVRKIEAAARAAEQNGCECWRITVVAHSQGTMLVKRALDVLDPKTKAHMSIIGLGGETTFGPGDGVSFARNVAQVNDPVPRKWNRASFWNGNDRMISFGYRNPADAPEGAPAYETAEGSWLNYGAHSWDNVYIPYLREHPLDVPRYQPVK